MANYNTIRGLRVKYLSADPANPEDGQVWYNSTTGNLRVDGILGTGTWASGGNYPVSTATNSGAGTQTAAIGFGGIAAPGLLNVSKTYDGSSWTGTSVLNTARKSSGSAKDGSQTAALMVGGQAGTPASETNVTEEYNGSSWTSVNNYPVSARLHDQATGTQTSALCSAGYTGSYITTTCKYDGTNWTALSGPSDMNAARFGGTTVGTQTAAIMFGGTSPSGPGLVESWNGSAWSEESANFNTPRNAGGSAGTSTNAIFFGGEPARKWCCNRKLGWNFFYDSS